jgi:hypothetical protein
MILREVYFEQFWFCLKFAFIRQSNFFTFTELCGEHSFLVQKAWSASSRRRQEPLLPGKN